MATADLLLTNAKIATMAGEGYGLIDCGAVAIEADRIAFVGAEEAAPQATETIDCSGRLITPGLIDCHTHLVFGGDRAREFELRLEGASYEEIARAGGGIVSTVAHTRAAGEDELVETALVRLDHLIGEGVTTVEIKSGYGLDLETELRMLRTARRLAGERQVQVVTTFLGAHAVPPEYSGKADAYIDFVCADVLPAVHAEGLADAVDGFCEGIAFSPVQIERVFEKAHELGLPIKLHAEQLSDLGGAALAARHGALSADHLEYLGADGVEAMAQAGAVAVLLPGAFYTLRETQLPPVDALREAGVPIALATDANPGSSPMTSVLLAMNMGCTLFRLTPAEALAAATANAARALGMADELGAVAVGRRADLCIWNVAEPAELAYRIGFNPLSARVFAGKLEGSLR